ncbi:MAG: PAS domain S-box protein [Gaiellaceae bacterium]
MVTKPVQVQAPPDVHAMVQQTLLGDAWEHAAVGVAVFSDDGRYIACNRAFVRLTGYEREEVLRMRVGVDLAHDREANSRLFDEIVADTRTTGSATLRRKDGGVVPVNFWAIETRAANLPFYLTVYWDARLPPSFA